MKKAINYVVLFVLGIMIGAIIYVSCTTVGYNDIHGVKQTRRVEDQIVSAEQLEGGRWLWKSYSRVIGNRYKYDDRWGLSAVDEPMTDVFNQAWDFIDED